jgi:hypothetical protein
MQPITTPPPPLIETKTMTDTIATFLEPALPFLHFFFTVILPFIGLAMIVYAIGTAIIKVFELFVLLDKLQYEIKYLRKQQERQQDKIYELQRNALK